MTFRLLWMSVLCLSGLAGCAGNARPEHQGSVEEHHGIPAYKPATFRDAVDQLPRRLAEVFEHGSEAPLAEQEKELTDIVQWLPELAAETDLRKADWEQVQRLALQLQQALAERDRNQCEHSTAELRKLAEQAPAGSEEMKR